MKAFWTQATCVALALIATAGVASHDGEPRRTPATKHQKRIAVKAASLGIDLHYDQAPRSKKITRPTHPRAAFEECVEGTVLLMIVIDEEGAVSDPEVLESVPGLDEAALKCVRDWRFDAARAHDRAVPTIALAPISFEVGPPSQYPQCKK